ncbi:hypothetical protein LLEC1_02661 [Akanthomyces lecanii]|uniref:lipoyl(octanoyl) transferase n=1 Tax=Cordyceps confragosa TaxID=2714763 RepID=A0A179IEI2_CORDF|nr:hypothetical protein LLEC1_02661 [Akanthomyces lecanii]
MKRAQRLLHHSNALHLRPSHHLQQHRATTARRHAPRRSLHLLQHQHMKLVSPAEPPFVDGTSVAYTPQVKKTNRGGLTTYHGPGQLVLWPILDMHSPLHARFGVASYARLLETTTQTLLADLFGIETYTNPDEPGVWVGAAGSGTEERKIAALGVHHRRYVTALGVALNVHLPVAGEDDGVNPWARFVPCGLQGKLVTSVAKETGRAEEGREWDMDGLADMWAARFEEGLLKG